MIDLQTLRTAIAVALDACEKQLGPRVRVNTDYYWHLPVDAAFDMTKEPSELTVGQLSDDLDDISVASGRPGTAGHDLAHAIGILRALESRLHP
ncbi:hypothetical protein [Cellulomonas sp. SLBN-39]|uniref:hypothetical protein n=1 Tax=Cellulomonas sp. SLBN-39 TaxID=2768446 RepID=UPI00115134DA|nr:hypothetical protein [Cellulomonas sp. SLBN-39]TQL01099.1 hypothetical protein FBY24_0142 [Cellulomonas sp. SLBN-39]